MLLAASYPKRIYKCKKEEECAERASLLAEPVDQPEPANFLKSQLYALLSSEKEREMVLRIAGEDIDFDKVIAEAVWTAPTLCMQCNKEPVSRPAASRYVGKYGSFCQKCLKNGYRDESGVVDAQRTKKPPTAKFCIFGESEIFASRYGVEKLVPCLGPEGRFYPAKNSQGTHDTSAANLPGKYVCSPCYYREMAIVNHGNYGPAKKRSKMVEDFGEHDSDSSEMAPEKDSDSDSYSAAMSDSE